MENFADIEGPVRIGFLWLLLLWGTGACLLALLIFLLFRYRRRRLNGRQAPGEPRRSPREVALERLSHLKSSKVHLPAEPFTVEVSDIVRDYLEEALKVPAREQTSEEFLGSLQSAPNLPPVLHEHMPAFLQQCDFVKFARQSLAGTQRESLLQTAETVVESTDNRIGTDEAPEEPASSKA
ncbi:MAG: hypothetical protein R6V45_10625 [Oceanipulchritudo sp.]